MNPDYFIIPLVMGQVTSIITALKTGYILIDICLFALLYLLYNSVNIRDIKCRLMTIHCRSKNKQTIVLTAMENHRSVKIRAIMHYLAKMNKTIYKIKEVSETSWYDDDNGREKEAVLSEYLVDQSKEFMLTDNIQGSITINTKEKNRGFSGTEYLEYNTLKIYSYSLTLLELQEWINAIVKEYKKHLKMASNEQQLYMTVASASASKRKSGSDADKGNKQKSTGLIIEAVPWESTISFGNSYFHDMDVVLKKIDFFLNNKQWYLEKGIPYNLGILLYGEPGCGKTRFIKQLMNHTGRHGIDIKLNDMMDFHDLYNIIFKEEISQEYIIPQNQRILIFEDIDAMGDAVKSRDNSKSNSKSNSNNSNKIDTSADYQKKDEEFVKVDPAILLAEILHAQQTDSLKHETAMFNAFHNNCSSNSSNSNNLSYLLNMFDGINECSGRIIIMTSNNPELLDKALVRPGRIDIKLHFQKCTTYDIMRMLNLFWNMDIEEAALNPDINMKYTSADLYNIFRSTNDFEEIKSIFMK